MVYHDQALISLQPWNLQTGEGPEQPCPTWHEQQSSWGFPSALVTRVSRQQLPAAQEKPEGLLIATIPGMHTSRLPWLPTWRGLSAASVAAPDSHLHQTDMLVILF